MTWSERSRDVRFRTIFFFGMASGLPSSLVFATLSIWLREEGVSRTSIGVIGAVATPYAINFLWAPLVDRGRLPGLRGWLGQRRSWIFGCQILLVPVVIAMGTQDPKTAAASLVVCALLVSFLSATQDVAIDAYRIEILEPHEYGTGAAIAIYGWHCGAFLTGAGALYVAAAGGWVAAYIAAAAVIAFISVATVIAREPEHQRRHLWVRRHGREDAISVVDSSAELAMPHQLAQGLRAWQLLGHEVHGRRHPPLAAGEALRLREQHGVTVDGHTGRSRPDATAPQMPAKGFCIHHIIPRRCICRATFSL